MSKQLIAVISPVRGYDVNAPVGATEHVWIGTVSMSNSNYVAGYTGPNYFELPADGSAASYGDYIEDAPLNAVEGASWYR